MAVTRTPLGSSLSAPAPHAPAAPEPLSPTAGLFPELSLASRLRLRAAARLLATAARRLALQELATAPPSPQDQPAGPRKKKRRPAGSSVHAAALADGKEALR